MPQLKLPKKVDPKHHKILINLNRFHQNLLSKYADLYRDSYGEDISLSDLILDIVSEFIASDEAFVESMNLSSANRRKNSLAGDNGPNAFHEPVKRFIEIKEVCHIIGLAKSMVYKMIKEGRFPPPYKLSPGASRWSEEEVFSWVENIECRETKRPR